MRAILIAMMLASCANAAPGYYVIGDSQCEIVDGGTAQQAWPHLIQSFTGIYMRNVCKSGRHMSSNVPAEFMRIADIEPSQDIKGVIIHLGTNDKMAAVLFSRPFDFTAELIDATLEAESRGLELICILPPDNGLFTNEDVRAMLEANCPRTIDGSQFVGPDDMPDGGHFDVEGHRKYAEGVMRGL